MSCRVTRGQVGTSASAWAAGCAALWLLAACAPGGGAPNAPRAPAEDDAKRAVGQLLERQVADWNRGDLDAFVSGYWRSPELTFISGGEVRRGFTQTLERYRATYPDRAAMGTLAFRDLELRVLSERFVLVRGRYDLARAGDAPWGRFTLLVERSVERSSAGDDGWRIVYDHTSSGTGAGTGPVPPAS